MIFVSQALLLPLPLFFLFIASFLGRYIPRLLVHLLITLQEEVLALGLSVLECFWSWCVSWSAALPDGGVSWARLPVSPVLMLE